MINNWRPYGTAAIGKRRRKLTYIDILCRTHVGEVDAEVKIILAEEEMEETPQNIFQQRRRAAKRIYERLDDSQKQAIDAKAEAHAALGYSEGIREV